MSWTTVTFSAGGFTGYLSSPDGSVAADELPLVVFFHGSGGSGQDVVEGFNYIVYFQPMVEALFEIAGGVRLLSVSTPANSWGSAAGTNGYQAAYDHVAANCGVSNVIFWPGSMGGLDAYLLIAAGTIANVVGCYAIYPVCSLANLYAQTWGSKELIDSSYGITGTAPNTYAGLTAGRDPMLLSGASFPNIGYRFTASYGDALVPRDENSNAMARKLAAAGADDVTVMPTTGGHGDSSNFVPTDFIQYLSRWFGITSEAPITIADVSIASNGKTVTGTVVGGTDTGYAIADWSRITLYTMGLRIPFTEQSLIGNALSLTALFPVAAGAVPDLTVTTDTTISDSSGTNKSEVSSYLGSNDSSVTVLLVQNVNFAESRVKMRGNWSRDDGNKWYSAGGGSLFASIITGTDVAAVAFSPNGIYAKIDAGAPASVTPLLGGAFYALPIVSGHADGSPFRLQCQASEGYFQDSRLGVIQALFLVAGASPAITEPPEFGNVHFLDEDPFVSLGDIAGLEPAGSYMGHGFFPLTSTEGATFIAATRFVAIWVFCNGGPVELLSGGEVVATATSAGIGWERLVFSGLSSVARHYALFRPGYGSTFFLNQIEIEGTFLPEISTVSASMNSIKLNLGMYLGI